MINLYKTPSNKAVALDLFDRFMKLITPDAINQDEAKWIEKATMSAMMYCEPYTGKGYKYDFTSMYPYLLQYQQFTWPVKRGEFKIMKNSELNPEYLTYGIYRAIIQCNNNKLFKTNFSNHYTHVDITRARKLKLKVQLIEDGQPNALVYTRNKLVNGNILFKKYVDTLFKLKQSGIPRAKAILNILWGVLCEKRTVELMYHSDVDNEVVIDDDEIITQMKPCLFNPNRTLITIQKVNSYYKTDWARIAPFILAKGRQLLSQTIEPYQDSIKWMHTDGFISSEELPLKLGSNLGDIKFEGFCDNCTVLNKLYVKGEFKPVS
jgi:hypothetical protein